ncbi:MAG TPA: DUF6691 family protein [Polyangiales bacterium]|nr:DUF6691 family protein [Polyangiales bacterium]
MKSGAYTLALGAFLGFGLSRIGFSSWDEVHRMFVFADLRMFLSFALAVPLLMLLWRVGAKTFATRVPFRARPIHRGTLLGGALFGVGWALSGACPSIVFVQLGEGQLGAVFTLAGMVVGNYLYSIVQQRYLRWDTGTCLDE